MTINPSAIIGETISEVLAMDIDFGTSYPTVDTETMLVTGVVDGNYPNEFNGGNWNIVDDNYAVATDGNDAE